MTQQRGTDYVHPDGGRRYREGDPAHRFAQLAQFLANEAREFVDHYDRRLKDRDYLMQHTEWTSDPDRIAHAMAATIAELRKAYTATIVDRELTIMDDEWRRKYGSTG